MTDPAYPAPHRMTLDDLDPKSATTDALTEVPAHRAMAGDSVAGGRVVHD